MQDKAYSTVHHLLDRHLATSASKANYRLPAESVPLRRHPRLGRHLIDGGMSWMFTSRKPAPNGMTRRADTMSRCLPGILNIEA